MHLKYENNVFSIAIIKECVVSKMCRKISRAGKAFVIVANWILCLFKYFLLYYLGIVH